MVVEQKKKRKIQNFLFYSVIIVGLGFVAYQPFMDYVVAPFKIDKLTEGLDDVDINENLNRIQSLTEEDEKDLFDYTDVQSISSSEIAGVHEIDKRSVIGFIYVPSIDFKTPILYGATHNNMLAGGGTLKPDQKMGEGNYSVAGHNHPNPNMMFAPIRHINKGDLMYMTDKKKVYTYKAHSKEVVSPKRVDLLEDDKEKAELTLMSCYASDGSNRIYVKGELIRVDDIEDVPKEIHDRLLYR